MKTKNKFLVSILLVLFMVFQLFSPVKASSSISEANTNIPVDATTYAANHYKEVIEVIKTYDDYYNVTATQLENVKLGIPFVIYELNRLVQDEIYYYPLLDSNNNVILLMSIMGTTEGWNISVSEEWVDELNKLGNITSEFIFYKSGNNLYAENKKEHFSVTGIINSDIRSFSQKSYQTKKQTISNATTRFVKTDVNNIFISDTNINDKYTPSFSTSTSSSKICSLYNKQIQGNLQLCWAATVATICNYRRGTSISPTAVADNMGIGYNDGASIVEGQQALKNHGVTYNNLNTSTTRMSWTSLKTNIDNKYPVYVSAKTLTSGHAVTAYGYSTAAGTNYVILWNSGSESSTTVTFKPGGTTFSYNNSTYTWTYSVSMYY